MAKGALRVSEKRGALRRVNYVCRPLRDVILKKGFIRVARRFWRRKWYRWKTFGFLNVCYFLNITYRKRSTLKEYLDFFKQINKIIINCSSFSRTESPPRDTHVMICPCTLHVRFGKVTRCCKDQVVVFKGCWLKFGPFRLNSIRDISVMLTSTTNLNIFCSGRNWDTYDVKFRCHRNVNKRFFFNSVGWARSQAP